MTDEDVTSIAPDFSSGTVTKCHGENPFYT